MACNDTTSFSRIMIPVGTTLLIIWLTPCNIASFLFLILCLVVIFHMHKLGRLRDHRRIRQEERQNVDHGKREEYESVEWLNLVFEHLWPLCLEKFTSEEFFFPMAPWFLETYKHTRVRKAVLQHLNLGKQPPKWSSVRVLDHPNDLNDYQLVVEAFLQFVTDDNMSAKLSVSSFGGLIPATLDITKFQIEGKIKLKVKFINGWPIIGHIQFSFVDVPDFRLTLRKFGMDLRFVDNLLKRHVAIALQNSVVKPNQLVVDMEMLVKNLTVPKLPGVAAKWFSVECLAENPPPPIGSVCVEILDVQHPQSDNKHGQFIEISVGANPAKTIVNRNLTSNAKIWDRQQLQIASWDLPNILILHVFSGSKRAKDLGTCAVWINDYKDGKWHVVTDSLQFRGKKNGQLKFAVKVEHDKVFQTTGCEELPGWEAYNSQPTAEEDEGPASTSTIRKPPNRPSVTRSKSDTQLHSKLPSKKKRTLPQIDNELSASPSAPVDRDATLSTPDEVQGHIGRPAFCKPQIKQKKRVKMSVLRQIFGLQKRRVASYCESLSG